MYIYILTFIVPVTLSSVAQQQETLLASSQLENVRILKDPFSRTIYSSPPVSPFF